LLRIARDPRVPTSGLTEAIAGVPLGSRYVLCALKPSDVKRQTDDLARALDQLTAMQAPQLPVGDYLAIAGRVGQAPEIVVAADRPFRRQLLLHGVAVEIRMDSWLASDTIRRMGFGHVVAAHQHTLIVERGLSFATFDDDGTPIRTAYAANIFAPEPRYLIDIAR
jgi:hypothetical protein